jgi:hypothetical protein
VQLEQFTTLPDVVETLVGKWEVSRTPAGVQQTCFENET